MRTRLPLLFTPSPRWRWVGLWLSVVLCTGCWGPATDQQPVSGKVTLGGEPLQTGTITFTPVESGRSAGGPIVDGEFSITRQDGPEPGTYRVSITARVPTGRKIENPSNPGEFADELQQIVPPRYNVQTELTAEVKVDEENFFEFHLDSV